MTPEFVGANWDKGWDMVDLSRNPSIPYEFVINNRHLDWTSYVFSKVKY
jgi:hypothetical protein